MLAVRSHRLKGFRCGPDWPPAPFRPRGERDEAPRFHPCAVPVQRAGHCFRPWLRPLEPLPFAPHARNWRYLAPIQPGIRKPTPPGNRVQRLSSPPPPTACHLDDLLKMYVMVDGSVYSIVFERPTTMAATINKC